ncbi:MAG: TonB-dependent receptor [Chitinophagaceae bacterium]
MNYGRNTCLYKLLLCCSLLLLPFIAVLANEEENNGVIKGTITTSDNQPADGVTVFVKGTRRTAVTQEDGSFTIRNLAAGQYTLEISLIGYTPVQQNVNVEHNKTTYVKLQLTLSNQQLQGVVVTAGKSKFIRRQSDFVAKMPLKNMENPQVYSSISKELLQDQVAVTYADAIKNSPGVVMQLENNSAGGTVTSRGFSTQSFLRNGVPGVVGSGTLDLSNIESIEVIKGPTGTLYGSSLVSFGGLFNRVTKRPFDTFKSELTYTAGGFGLSRITADVNTPLNKDKTLLLRVNAARHNEGSFQDAGFKSYVFIAPTLTYAIDTNTTVTVDAEYRNERGNSFYRMFADGSYATGARSPKDLKLNFRKRFSGDDIVTYNTMANLFVKLDHDFSSQWHSQTSYTYLSSNANGLSGYLSMLAGNNSLVRYMSNTEYANSAVTDIQQNLTGDFKIGKMRNRLLVGLDFYSITTKSSGGPTVAFDTVNVAKPGTAYTQLTRLALLDRYKGLTFTKSKSQQYIYSAYVQDVLNITDNLIALAGVRIDYYDNKGTANYTRDTTTGKYNQTAVSPKFGLVYQVIKEKISLFANYMNGFQNIAPVTQPDGTISTFKPSQANQWEAGVKLNLLDNRLTGSISYYDIQVKNITRNDLPARPTYTVQDGDQASKGFEAEIVAYPFSNFGISAGYAYNDSKYKKINPTLDGFRPISAGPANIANLWLSYRIHRGLLDGLGLGLGGNYASENKVILSTTSYYALPAYTVLGASVSYDRKRFRLGLKVDNLTNKDYWVGWSTTIPQMPRRFSGTVAFKF